MFQTKVVEKIRTHAVSGNIFFFTKNLALYEIMLKIVVELYRSQMTIWRMLIAFCITKATDTHSKYLIIVCSG
jgi:hypothetical protein